MEKKDKALRIKIMLQQKGITQRALAKKLGMSPQSLSNRLNGDTPLDANLIVSLRPILGDEVMELVESPGESPPSEDTRPRVDLYARGGQNEALDGVALAQCEQVPVVPLFPRYDFTMRITGQPIDIKLEPEALELIGKHRGTDYLVDVLDRHKDYRNYLKRMGEALKSMGGVTYEYRKTKDGKHRVVAVRKITWPKLSPYWARHTWASIAYSIGVPIDVIGQAMGHSDRRVTEIYIAKDSSRVDEANRRVIDWVLYQRR